MNISTVEAKRRSAQPEIGTYVKSKVPAISNFSKISTRANKLSQPKNSVGAVSSSILPANLKPIDRVNNRQSVGGASSSNT